MNDSAKAAVGSALDALALALVDYGHAWTRAERRAYETAVRLLSPVN